MYKKVLTIIVPSYNVEKYLTEVMPHFLDDRILNDIEVLIINDGSKDSTQKIAEGFQNEFPNTVRAIYKENGGHGSTINRGIQESVAKYIKVVDGDDWVETEEFVKMVQNLKTEDADVVLTPFKRVFVDVKKEENVEVNGLEPFRRYPFDEVAAILESSYQMHCITIKTEILKRIKPIREKCFYVDQEYNLYPVPYIGTIVFYPYNVYRYRLGIAEQSMNIKNMQKNREMHEKVTLDLLNSYLDMDLRNSPKASFVEKRIESMCERQIRIWLSMDTSSEVKNELALFLNTVKTKSPQIYKKIPGKKAKILRLIGIRGYRIVSIIQHRSDKKRR